MRRSRRILGVLAAVWMMAGSAGAERVITLTFTGDCTLGNEEVRINQSDSFYTCAEREGYDYFFACFRDMFSQDDLTVINLEGVLSDSPKGEVKDKSFRFRGPTDYVRILTGASVELAGLANNHTVDYGPRGLADTKETLEKAGIGWIRSTEYFTLEKAGIRICFFAADYAIYNSSGKEIKKKIAALKENGEADAVVVLFHNGAEYSPKHTTVQEQIGNTFVDCGADLVIMHHPHVVQGIQIRNNRTICYSLGNFVYGGNRLIHTDPTEHGRYVTSRYSLVVQAKMLFSDDGDYIGQQVILIPAYISDDDKMNHYQPYRLTAREAEPVMDAVQFDTLTELPGISEDENGYARVIMPYLSADATEDAESVPGELEKPAARPWR